VFQAHSKHRDAAMRALLAVKKQIEIPYRKPETQVAAGQHASRLELADGCWQVASSCRFSPTNCIGSVLGSFLVVTAEITTVSSA